MLWAFSYLQEPVQYRRPLPFSINPLLGDTPFRLACPAAADSLPSRSSSPAVESRSELQLPALALLAVGGLTLPGEDEAVSVPPAAQPLPLQAQAAETMVFAIAAPYQIAASLTAVAPALTSQAAPSFLSRAEHARPLLVSTAPAAAKWASPAANLLSTPSLPVQLPKFEVTAAQRGIEPAPVPQACDGHAPVLVSAALVAAQYASPAVDSVSQPAGAVRLPQMESWASGRGLEPAPMPQAYHGHALLQVSTAPVAAQHTSPEVNSVSPPAGPVRLPNFAVAATEACFEPVPVPPACQGWMVGPAAEPVAVEVLAASATESCSVPAGPVRLPTFAVAAVGVELVPVPAACQGWMASPAAEPVAVEVLAASAAENCSVPAARLPNLRHFSVAHPWMPISLRLRPSPSAEPVSTEVWPQSAMGVLPAYGELPAPMVPEALQLQFADQVSHVTPAAPPVAGLAPEAVETMVLPGCEPAMAPSAGARVLRMPDFIRQDVQTLAALAGQATAPEAEPVESMPAFAAYQPVPLCAIPELRLPSLPALLSEDIGIDGLNPLIDPGARPSAPLPAAHPVTVEPMRTLFVVPPRANRPESPLPAVALRGFVPLDFFSQRTAGVPAQKMVWRTRATQPILPGLALHPIFERLEEAAPQKKNKQVPAFAEIFKLQEAARKKAGSPMVRQVIKTIAACLVLGTILWFGVGTVRIGNQSPVVNRDVSLGDLALSAPSRSAVPTPGSLVAGGLRSGGPGGTMARIRGAIADRAAATVTDSFRHGMEAWGAASKQWAPGWSRHPDGYVQTGQLALFQPSQNFKDYHMEFFGEIESRSMGWAVRAHDKQNYYAMKLAVMEPGLRPMIAMMHYPVVGGVKGRPVEIPLNVMVHNNRPMQVEVDVRGNKLLTSIDGQLVDTWIDDTLVSGGVGFFSEAGERARLYWMKISKNEDFLGRICAYVSNTLGDGTRASAEVWPGEAPSAPQPQPAPERTQEAALASAAAGLQNRFTKDSRREKWNS